MPYCLSVLIQIYSSSLVQIRGIQVARSNHHCRFSKKKEIIIVENVTPI
jgi:hypothetical protein